MHLVVVLHESHGAAALGAVAAGGWLEAVVDEDQGRRAGQGGHGRGRTAPPLRAGHVGEWVGGCGEKMIYRSCA